MKNKTSQIRNLIPRRQYKERGQLEARKHMGLLLEKHKDYKKRSANFKQKDRVIKKLSEKAQLRNPDEFYHKMKHARFQEGTHQVTLKGNQEAKRKSLEQKDISLVQMGRVAAVKKAEKIQANLHMVDMPKGNSHISFVSSLDEIKGSRQEADDEEVAFRGNAKLQQEVLRMQSENKQQYKRLADAVSKAEQYSKVLNALELDKQLKGKGKKQKVEVAGKTMFKWFSERKR